MTFLKNCPDFHSRWAALASEVCAARAANEKPIQRTADPATANNSRVQNFISISSVQVQTNRDCRSTNQKKGTAEICRPLFLTYELLLLRRSSAAGSAAAATATSAAATATGSAAGCATTATASATQRLEGLRPEVH